MLSGRHGLAAWCALLLAGAPAQARDLYVSTTGSDAGTGSATSPFRKIQKGADALQPGDVLHVQPGTYKEKIVVRRSGSASGGWVTIQAEGAVTLSGLGVSGSDMIRLENQSWVRIKGFEIRDNKNVSDGSGVRVTGAGDHIEIRNNKIHEIRGHDAMGITIYGTNSQRAISDLVIDGNEVYDCDPAESEALTLNGNIERFAITNNKVHDVNNIGIDMIGGEDVVADPTKVPRDGVCCGNEVWRARSSYGGGYGAGIYVDGARDIIIERNVVHECDLGIEIGAENPGIVTRGVVVRDNVLYANDKAGIVFGGYDQDRGRVKECRFTNNTLYKNDTKNTGNGEIWIQWAEKCRIENNVFFAGSQSLIYNAGPGSKDNQSDYNAFHLDAGAASAKFVWRDVSRTGFTKHVSGSGQDSHSQFASPRFVNAVSRDFKLAAGSPAIDRGNPGFAAGSGETDFAGAPRVQGGRVDVGAFESAGTAPVTTTRPATPPSTPGFLGALTGPTLEQEATGADVEKLQRLLNAKGYLVSVDGDFGAKTFEAVKKFQRSRGLEDDGVVGPRTWRALGEP